MDLVDLTGMHASLPLIAATMLLSASLLISKLCSRWLLWIRVLAQFTLFIVLTMLVQASLTSPLQPEYGNASGAERVWRQLIEASWWVVVGRLASGIARLFIVLESRPRETRIISDLVAGAISVATILAIVNFAFEVPIRNLLATSGVIAIVLGLALQSTLSDVFSGIAVGIERPYNVGDLIWVEGGIEGRVLQVNWRSTHIATADRNIAMVPNSVVAKARLVNRSAPSSARGATIAITLDAKALPEVCETALIGAARSCCIMQATPAPTVTCTELKGDGASWEIAFSIDSPEKLASAKTELITQVHRHLRHAGIALAVSNGLADKVTLPSVARLLEESPLFGTIPALQRESLVPYFQPVQFAGGDVLHRANEKSKDLLIITSGTVEITIPGSLEPQVVYRMSPGETLGAVGLLTDVINAATATALTPVRAFRIGREGLDKAITDQPELATALQTMAAGVAANMAHHDVDTSLPMPAQPRLFLSRLRSFLEVLDN